MRGEQDDETSKAARSATEKATNYWYGYDAEHAKAFRAHHDGSHYELGDIEVP
jgi:hypothetical protein